MVQAGGISEDQESREFDEWAVFDADADPSRSDWPIGLTLAGGADPAGGLGERGGSVRGGG